MHHFYRATLPMHKAVELKEIRKSYTIGALRTAIDAEQNSTLVFDKNYAKLLAEVHEDLPEVDVRATAEDCAALRDASALRCDGKSVSH